MTFTHPTLHYSFFSSSLGFEISYAWTSSTYYASDMAYLFPRTWFGPHFKHAKGVDIVIWRYLFLIFLSTLFEVFFGVSFTDRELQPPCPTCTGVDFPSGCILPFRLGRKHRWEAQFIFLTPPEMLLCPSPYSDIPKQLWNPMLAGVNPVNSVVTKIQPAQPDNPEAWVY